jgi:FkbM family methyltransferase
MMTAAIRDLHLAYPREFETDVRTPAEAIWEHNPFLSPLEEGEPGVEALEMHYPLIHQSNQRPYHFLHGYVQYLEQRLGLRIPVTRFQGDVYLTREEKSPDFLNTLDVPDRFWIIVAGGKYDLTAKWWNPVSYQHVVDHFRGRISFVQCGRGGDWHRPLDGVINLVGKTTLRDFIRLMHHADGVVCPVTFAMHLAAAVETKPGRPSMRPCVVIAGGREPPHWEAYPHHQFISTVGALSCCAHGGCWKSRCQAVGDGDEKDWRGTCDQPVQVAANLCIPRCMEMISTQDVTRRIKIYLDGGIFEPTLSDIEQARHPTASRSGWSRVTLAETQRKKPDTDVLIRFRHGLGDAVQLTTVLQHLAYYCPEWQVDVASLAGKHSAFHGLCRHSAIVDEDALPKPAYDWVFDLDWTECSVCYTNCPSTKAERCLEEVFGIAPRAKFCTYKLNVSGPAKALARSYLEKVCKTSVDSAGRFKAVLIHYEGNTSHEKKNISTGIARQVCQVILDRGFVPVILDWDSRTSLADGTWIHNVGKDPVLWRHRGTGDAEILAALTEMSSLMIGVDSGPLHVAGACTTPTVGIWVEHHPLHYFALANNVTHLVPEHHMDLLRGDRRAGEAFFSKYYRFHTYSHLGNALVALVQERLTGPTDGLIEVRGFWIRADNAEQDLVIVEDIAERDAYGIDALHFEQPIVVDIGAHIGCFSQKVRARNPSARIIAVECCPENMVALEKNVGAFAAIMPAAATYEANVALLNAVFPHCRNTGGSRLVSRRALEEQASRGEFPHCGVPGKDYWADLRMVRTVTLEEIMQEHALDRIDVLKLDCEGEELSILRNTSVLDRIGIIVGEYHDKQAFVQLVSEHLAGWKLRILRDGEPGTFWLMRR